jgi:hypothetical protein
LSFINHGIWLLLVDCNFQALGGRFLVGIDMTTCIYHLKKMVKEERQNDLAHIDAARFTVWKTKDIIDESALVDLLRRIINDKDTIEELHAGQPVADLGLSDDQTLLVQLPGMAHGLCKSSKRALEMVRVPIVVLHLHGVPSCMAHCQWQESVTDIQSQSTCSRMMSF